MSIKIKLDDWWGDESAIIKENSDLYKLKMEFITAILRDGLITKKDLKERNMVPHIRLTDNQYIRNMKAYNTINNSQIDPYKALKINGDNVEIDTGYSGYIPTHMTLIYKPNIWKKSKRINEIYRSLIKNIFNIYQ